MKDQHLIQNKAYIKKLGLMTKMEEGKVVRKADGYQG